MNNFKKISCFWMLLQVVTQNVVSLDVSKPAANSISTDGNGRRSGGIIILQNPGNPDGHITSHKIETKTYTTHLTSGNAGSGVQGWVSGTRSGDNIVLQPQIQSIVQKQGACGLNNNLVTNAGDQSSTVHKNSNVDSSEMANADSSFKILTPNEYQWQTKKASVKPLVVGQLNGQTQLNGHSQVTGNNIENVSSSTTTTNTGNQEINTLQQIDNIQKHENLFHPDNNSYKVSLISSGDEIYANEPTGHANQNLNVMVTSDSNSPNIMAVPVLSPKVGQIVLQGYRPNIQHYLKEIETSNIIKNPSVLRVPSFMKHIKPDQMNINLTEDQLNSYKQYLIRSGLIKLKPYQLIFSDQFRPKLKTLQWMVVPLESNAEFCKQRCGALFPRDTLYSTLAEEANKLPLKLLVPVLKIRGGLTKTLSGIQTIADGVSDVPGLYQVKQSLSNIAEPSESTMQN